MFQYTFTSKNRFFRIFRHVLTIILYFIFSHINAQSNFLERGISKLLLSGCSIQGNEIKIVGSGNTLTHKAYFNCATTLEEIDLNFEIRVDSLNSSGDFKFGIGKQATLAGTLIEFAGTDTTSQIIVNRLDGSSIIFMTQYTLPFKLAIGTPYKIRIGKRIRNLVIEVQSASDYYINDTLSYPSTFFGCLWGTPLIGCAYGQIAVMDFSLKTPLNKIARLAAWGDSFIEGNSLPNFEDRYVTLIKDSIGYQNISLLGHGGESSSSINSRFSKESQWFSGVKYGFIALGVNDANFIVWKSNMIKYIDTLKKHNIIPIIATITPRAGRMPFINSANDWIRNIYDGAYIDITKVVSFNGSNWSAGMALSDSVHPSVVGHKAIYDRITIEAPYIFRDTAAFNIDYINETTFENVSNTLQYSSSSHFTMPTFGTQTPIQINPGTVTYFRDTITTGIHTIFDIVSAPPRPAAPTNPVVDSVAGTFDWTNNPFYTSASDYEYSNDNGITWTTCSVKPNNYAGSQEIQLRVKATTQSFKSSVLYFYDLFTSITPVNDFSRGLKIYPNPVNDKLIIENIIEESMLTITSADGRLWKSILLNAGTNTINTTELNRGFYIFTLENATFRSKFKIIKE